MSPRPFYAGIASDALVLRSDPLSTSRASDRGFCVPLGR
jgi:hypothetical protein